MPRHDPGGFATSHGVQVRGQTCRSLRGHTPWELVYDPEKDEEEGEDDKGSDASQIGLSLRFVELFLRLRGVLPR